jgi:hypothetical protein
VSRERRRRNKIKPEKKKEEIESRPVHRGKLTDLFSVETTTKYSPEDQRRIKKFSSSSPSNFQNRSQVNMQNLSDSL